jgi:hypothetical protein
MQASLQDFSATPTSPSFLVCQRTLHRCHEIIFAELPPPPSGPYSGLPLSYHSPFARRRVKPRVEPALVGIGLVLAGVPAMPALTEVMGEVALQQGRADDDEVNLNLRSVEAGDDLARDTPANADSGEDDDNPSDEKLDNENTGESANDTEKRTPTRSIPRRRCTIVAAQTSPALVHLRDVHRSRLSEDPLDQQDSPLGRVSSPYQSSPSISSSPSPLKHNVIATADALLQRYDIQSQSHLLRSHYCRSEVCPPLYASTRLRSSCIPRHYLVLSRFCFFLCSRVYPTASWLCLNLHVSVLCELN